MKIKDLVVGNNYVIKVDSKHLNKDGKGHEIKEYNSKLVIVVDANDSLSVEDLLKYYGKSKPGKQFPARLRVTRLIFSYDNDAYFIVPLVYDNMLPHYIKIESKDNLK